MKYETSIYCLLVLCWVKWSALFENLLLAGGQFSKGTTNWDARSWVKIYHMRASTSMKKRENLAEQSITVTQRKIKIQRERQNDREKKNQEEDEHQCFFFLIRIECKKSVFLLLAIMRCNLRSTARSTLVLGFIWINIW